MLARSHDGGNGEVHRGLTARGGDGPNAAFKRCDPLLEHRGGGVGDARVHVAGAFGVEQRRRMIGIPEDVGCRLVDGRRAGAGCGIGLLAGVQAQGVEVDVSGFAHRLVSSGTRWGGAPGGAGRIENGFARW